MMNLLTTKTTFYVTTENVYVKELDGKQLMNSYLEYILLPTGKAGEKNRMRENKDIIGRGW